MEKQAFWAFQGGNVHFWSIMFVLFFWRFEMNTNSPLDCFQMPRKKIPHCGRPYVHSNFIAQVEKNSFNPGHKITSQFLIGPSPVITNIPFKSKTKWYSPTFDSPSDFFGNRDVVVISCNPYSICGPYVNVSLHWKIMCKQQHHIVLSSSSPMTRMDTGCMISPNACIHNKTLTLRK